MKKSLFVLPIIILCISCSKPFYQLYKTSSENTQATQDMLINQDDNVSVKFDFWTNNGDGSIFIYNRSDQEVFVDLGRSHLVKNDLAYTYYPAVEVQSSTQLVSTGLYMKISLMSPTNVTSLAQLEVRVICLPPKSGKIIPGPRLATSLFTDYELFPGKKEEITVEYSRENSPLTFRNIITYSFDERFEEFEVLDAEFWVSEIGNYRSADFIKTYQVMTPEGEAKSYAEDYRYKHPDSFYIRYKDGDVSLR